MAADSSFDIVSKIDMAEVKNAVNHALSEIQKRYDFKGSKSDIVIDEKENKMTVTSDDTYKLKAVIDVLQSKFVKRKVPLKNLVYGNIEDASCGTARQVITLQQGIPMEKAKQIIKEIKGTKLKVQSSIQQDQVRVSSKKKDDLQAIISLLQGKDFGVELQFLNYR